MKQLINYERHATLVRFGNSILKIAGNESRCSDIEIFIQKYRGATLKQIAKGLGVSIETARRKVLMGRRLLITCSGELKGF